MYEIAGDNVIVRPNEGIKVSLVPPPDDSYVLWKAGWVSGLDKRMRELVESLWIPAQYILPKERKLYEEIVVMRNGGRSSDIVIPEQKVILGDVTYNLNVLNCKGTGVSANYLRGTVNHGDVGGKKRRVGYARSLYSDKKFSVVESIISRELERHDRPLGGVSIDGVDSEIDLVDTMISEGLPHTPYAIATVIPERIRTNISRYNAKHVYPDNGYQKCHDSGRWVKGPLAQIKRFFTTNIRMNFATRINDEYRSLVWGDRKAVGWLQPKMLARLVGRCDGRYESFLSRMESEGLYGSFTGGISSNRTIDGLLTDGENLEFSETNNKDFGKMFLGSERFLKRYCAKAGKPSNPVMDAYMTVKKKESEGKTPLVIPKS
jgi:hypothetical protein